MVRENGSSNLILLACDEIDLRNYIKCVSAGKTKLTDDQLVDLLLSAFPQSYCPRDFLIRRITLLAPAIEEPTSVTKKRRKIDENQVMSSSASASSSGSDDRELETDGSEDESETNEDSDGAGTDANGNNGPISRDLVANDELGDGRREMNKKGDDELRDLSGKMWPMLGDLYGKDRDGDDETYEEVKREVTLSMHHLNLLRHLGTNPLTGILLHGPPGCGKTTWAQAIVNEARVPYFVASAAALVSGVPGAPGDKIRELFFTAHMRAPSIVLIEGIKPSIVNQLMACMMELYRFIKPVHHDADSGSSKSIPGHVLVIGTTNRPGALDPAFRRCFREIGIDIPDKEARLKILSHLTCNLKLKAGFDLEKIAQCTLGFVAGDLAKLVKKATEEALERIIHRRIFCSNREGVQFEDRRENCYRQPFSDEELQNLSITIDHFVVFDEILYVPLPSPEERGAILKALARDKPIQPNVDLMALGKDVACHNFNAVDLATLMKESALAAIDRPMMFDKGRCRPLT